ncbi:ankyrin repeat-containing domain protein [Xylaria palmicola]|nr:ankyrin repeat-containing domain protein [Xylaria palmicola]
MHALLIRINVNPSIRRPLGTYLHLRRSPSITLPTQTPPTYIQLRAHILITSAKLNTRCNQLTHSWFRPHWHLRCLDRLSQDYQHQYQSDKMPRGHTSRHMQTKGGKAPHLYYSAEAFREFSEFSMQGSSDNNDEFHRRLDLGRRWSSSNHDHSIWTQADQQELNELTARKEELEELRRAPLRKDIEDRFDGLGLPALPPPLPKKSEWLGAIVAPRNYPNAEVRPFFAACAEGSLATVRRWVTERKETLLQVGVQDGLALAARANQVEVVRYLLLDDKNEERGGGAHLDGSVIEGACENRSLPLFELCLQHHGYHPNQQVPSNDGHFGVALIHCLDDEDITRVLLRHGADPDLAPFQDGRRLGWGSRASPPMDRTCGLALDRAVQGGSSLAVVQMLLDHGANTNYARPLHGVISRRRRRQHLANTAAGGEEKKKDDDDWRPLMEMLIERGADVDSLTRASGTPLRCAISSGMWDIVEFLLERRADPMKKTPYLGGGDLFSLAAERAGFPWAPAEQAKQYLERLANSIRNEEFDGEEEAPEEVIRNPLVRALQALRARRIENVRGQALSR